VTSMTTEGHSADVVIKYRPQGKVLNAFHDDMRHRVHIVRGPIGSGKTFAAAFKLLYLITNSVPLTHVDGKYYRKSRILVARNTTVELKASTIPDWREIFTDDIGKYVGSPTPKQSIKFIVPEKVENGEVVAPEFTVLCDVLFMGFDEPGQIKTAKGLQLTYLWIDEIRYMPRDIVKALAGRTGRYPKRADVGGYYRCTIGTTNPYPEDSWLYELEKKTPVSWRFYIQPPGVIKVNGEWVENKNAENLNNLQPGYYADQIDGATEDFIRVELANQVGYLMSGRPIHPSYVDGQHSSPTELDYIDGLPLYLGLDQGRNPACVVLQILDGRVRVIGEYQDSGISAPDFADNLKEHLVLKYGIDAVESAQGWCDPAGASRHEYDDTFISILRASGLDIDKAPTNDPLIRRGGLDKLLNTNANDGKPKIIVSKSCTLLRRALSGGYHYRKLRVAGGDRYSDTPEKNDSSDIAEALHYGLNGLGYGVDLNNRADPGSRFNRRRQVRRRANWLAG